MTKSRPLTRWLVVAGIASVAAGAQAADPASVARGKYLFDAGDCSGCHAGNGTSAAPSGGLGLDTPFGKFRAPNITPDKQYGIGNWSETEFRRALREGVGKHGEYLFPVFPYTSFTRITDSDATDIYAYLMTLPAVPAPNKPHEATPPFSWRSLLFFWRTLFFTEGPRKPDATKGAEWNRGDYLIHAVAHCEECHTPRNALGASKSSMAFSGNVGGPDGQNAPNITSDVATGIGDWSIADIQMLLKTGMTPDSDLVGSGMKAVVRGTSKLTDADRRAMAVYLKSVPPIHVAAAPKPAAKTP
jgi:mono/diheme cytochrome c family protein